MNHSNQQRKWPTGDGLRVGHVNINSAINKIHEIGMVLHNLGTPFHMFGVTESRITEKMLDNDISIPGYTVEKRFPQRQLETGVLVYISCSLTTRRLYHLEQFGVECIWLELKLKNSAPILFGFIYRNPEERTGWTDSFCDMIDAVVLESKEFLLLGDFNIDLLKPNTTWLDIVAICNITQLVDTPTRTTATSQTLIDHIYTSDPQHITEICVPPIGCSDHFPVCLTWHKKGTKIPKAFHKTISYRSFKRFVESDFLLDLSLSRINDVYDIIDPEDAIVFWHQQFLSVYNKHAPLHQKRVKHYSKPNWLDNELQEAIHKRDHLKKKGLEEEYKRQRNKVTSLKRAKMKDYFNKLIDCNKNTKIIWRAINEITNKSKPTRPATKLSPQLLNQHFASVSDRVILDDRSHDNQLDKLREFCNSKQVNQTLHVPFMSVHDVYKFLNDLKQTGTRGLDDIDNRILKLSAPIITDSLTYIYNLCLSRSYFPSFLKQAKVIPIHKSGSTGDPNNYRPISILSALSKPLERHIHSNILKHLTDHSLLHSKQSGFRPHHSCHTALTSMIEQWLENINNNEFTAVLFVDFAKAFDVVDHNLLKRKLELYHLDDDCLRLLDSFLSNRSQTVCISDLKSSSLPVHYGVPQGSVLGPLLFSLYVNDLPLHLSSQCEMFADDTTMHSEHNEIEPLAISIQDSIQELQSWTELNHMAVNPTKTEVMLITTRQKRQVLPSSLPPITLGNQTIKEVRHHKLLGVTIDNNLSWSEHVSTISKTISKKVFQLTRIKKFLNHHSRKLFYTAHIQSTVDYASTLWDSASGNVMKPLVRVIRRAIKAVLLKPKINDGDFVNLGILPLHDRLKYNKVVFMRAILSGKLSQTLSRCFSVNNSRHYTKLNTPIPRLDLFKTSLVYSGSVMWNNLPIYIQQARRRKKQFKTLLFKHLLLH
jgi:hypothetical protein